jgi:hypothetical protein
MSEMREQAYESNIIPTQRLMAAELRTQLLPDFGDVRGSSLTSTSVRCGCCTLYRRMLTDVHTLAEDGLRITFELDAQGTRNFLASAGQNITGINATTLQAVREALLTGQSQGETVEQIAQRLSALPEFDQVRATLIARTELAQASNLAAVHVYRSSGVVLGIRIIDGEDFDEPCKARNGKILTLDAALNEPPLLHPRCTAKFAPLTDPSLMEAAA